MKNEHDVVKNDTIMNDPGGDTMMKNDSYNEQNDVMKSEHKIMMIDTMKNDFCGGYHKEIMKNELSNENNEMNTDSSTSSGGGTLLSLSLSHG